MRTGSLSRTLVVAQATVLSTLQGTAGLGLAGAALVFPLLVAAIGSAGLTGVDLVGTSEALFSGLFLPVILLLVCLVQGASLFRAELEEDTLLYPLKRTVPRPSVVAGKYLGFLGTTLLALVPSAVIGLALAVALGHGPTHGTPGLIEAALVLPTLGVIAYGAAFLLLGLLTRSALVIGLVYGFLWETFVSLLPGPIPQWTLVYYLRKLGSQMVDSTSSSPSLPALPGTAAGFALFATGCLVLASVVLRYAETRSAPAPA